MATRTRRRSTKPKNGPVTTRIAVEVNDLAAKIPTEYKACRGGGHVLEPFDPYKHVKIEPDLKTYKITRPCLGCVGLSVIERTVRGGHLVKSKFEYPGGYLLPKGSGRVTRGEVHMAMLVDTFPNVVWG